MGPPTRMGTTCRFRDGFDGGFGTPGSGGAIGVSAVARIPPVEATARPAPASAGFLNRTDIQDDYIRRGEVLISTWGTLSPAQRATNGLALVNATLAGQLPPLQGLPATDAGHNLAVFIPGDWGITINAKLVMSGDVPNPPPLRADETRQNDPRFVLSALYHEARHAEQRFLAARYLAATRHRASPMKIAHDLQIPRRIARAAIAQSATLRGDRKLVAFAKWLYIGGFSPAAAATQAAHQATTDATRAAADRAKRFIEANAAEWMGRGIAGNIDARTGFEQREAFERYKLAMRNRYHAFDAYAQEIKEADARMTSYRVAALLGVTNNRIMELLGKRLAIDGMRDP
jgi:hypothetical protein